MKNNILVYLEVAKVIFDQCCLKVHKWWRDLTGSQRSNICGVGVITSIILALVIFFSTVGWLMDRALYIGDKHSYEDYLDRAPEMPRFRDRYRIVKYSDNDFVVQRLINDKWTEKDFGIGQWWSLSTARNSMWSAIETDADAWIHANAQELAEVIE